MSFTAFLSQFKPPLVDEALNKINAEHERLVAEAIRQAKKEWRKEKQRREKGTLITATEAEEE